MITKVSRAEATGEKGQTVGALTCATTQGFGRAAKLSVSMSVQWCTSGRLQNATVCKRRENDVSMTRKTNINVFIEKL